MITNQQKENRAERVAYCRADNVPDEEILKIFAAYPDQFGTSEQSNTTKTLKT